MNAKLVKILISIKYEEKDGKLYQHFVFGPKNKKSIDNRFLIYDRFKSMILDSQPNRSIFSFVEMLELEDRFTVIFDKIAECPENELCDIFYMLSDFVPADGCKYCKHKKEENLSTFFCEARKKYMTKEIKKCRTFLQGEVIFNK